MDRLSCENKRFISTKHCSVKNHLNIKTVRMPITMAPLLSFHSNIFINNLLLTQNQWLKSAHQTET